MNKKDCINIGFILSEYPELIEITQRFFGLDSRIEEEYNLFCLGNVKREQTDEDRAKLMIKKFGINWPLMKCAKEEYHKLVRNEKLQGCAGTPTI